MLHLHITLMALLIPLELALHLIRSTAILDQASAPAQNISGTDSEVPSSVVRDEYIGGTYLVCPRPVGFSCRHLPACFH